MRSVKKANPPRGGDAKPGISAVETARIPKEKDHMGFPFCAPEGMRRRIMAAATFAALTVPAVHATAAHAADTLVRGGSRARSSPSAIDIVTDAAASGGKALAFRPPPATASKTVTTTGPATRLDLRLRGFA